MLKLYLKIVFIAVLTIVIMGLIAPALISAASTEATILGIVTCILMPAVMALLLKNIIEQIKKEEK